MGLLCGVMNITQAQIRPFGASGSLYPTATSNSNNPSDSAQRDSSEKRPLKPRLYPKSISAANHWFKTDTLRFSDTQLLLNHRYTQFQRSALPIIDLGTPGSPQLILNHQSYKGGFTLGLPLADAFTINPNHFDFHKVGQPYTRFQYSQGAGFLTGLEALHTQNFSPTWNVALQYRSIINQDMYTGSTQDNLLRNLGLGSHFISQNGRYEQQIILSWNRNRRLENGGFANDTLFYGTTENISETPILRTFGIYVPRLPSAESFLSNTHHRFQQRYFLSKQKRAFIWHGFDYQNDRFTYTDKSRDVEYYGSAFGFNPNKVDDSTSLRYGLQQLGWGYTDTQKIGILSFEAGYRYQHAHLRTQLFDTLQQARLLGSHGYQIRAQLKQAQRQLILLFQQHQSGYLKNTYDLQLRAQQRLNDSATLDIYVQSQQQAPNLFHTFFLSNHFDFRGKLIPDHRIVHHNVGGRYAYRSQNLELGAELQAGQITGEVRALYDPTPSILRPYTYIQSTLNFRYSTPKHWMFVASAHAQSNNAKEWDNLGLPYLFSRLGLSYQNNAFSKALIYRLGFDVSYMSKAQAYQYRADNRQFYANSQNITLGNYPLLDVYFSGRIKTVDFFLKYEHLNHWWVLPFANQRYESTLNYPIQPDRFRFGFIWHFWN